MTPPNLCTDQKYLKEGFDQWRSNRGVSYWTDQRARLSAIRTAGTLIEASEPYAEESLHRISKVPQVMLTTIPIRSPTFTMHVPHGIMLSCFPFEYIQGSRLAALSFMDENAFVNQFDYETKESAVHDIEELTKNKRIPQAIRKAVQQSLEQWLAVDHGTFWEDQRKAVTAKKALSDAQTAIIGLSYPHCLARAHSDVLSTTYNLPGVSTYVSSETISTFDNSVNVPQDYIAGIYAVPSLKSTFADNDLQMARICTSGKRDIELTMTEHRLWEVNANGAECLPLGLVDGHGEGGLDWELTPCAHDRTCAIIDSGQRDAREKDALTFVCAKENVCMYYVSPKVPDNEPRAIAKTLLSVHIAYENHTLSDLQPQFISANPEGSSEFKYSTGYRPDDSGSETESCPL
ncbi:hypothetical protein EDD21DRAFT_429696 [Dissophora ornata]|nr:hypothetical protein EDD21DRAFT_429696 [Dissophora ornata]